jgi:hypothetical protein
LIWKQSSFASAFLSEHRASKYYNDFIETFCVYQDLFEGTVSVQDIMETPYPVYRDVILTQIKRRKKQNELLKKQQSQHTSVSKKSTRQ